MASTFMCCLVLSRSPVKCIVKSFADLSNMLLQIYFPKSVFSINVLKHINFNFDKVVYHVFLSRLVP